MDKVDKTDKKHQKNSINLNTYKIKKNNIDKMFDYLKKKNKDI